MAAAPKVGWNRQGHEFVTIVAAHTLANEAARDQKLQGLCMGAAAMSWQLISSHLVLNMAQVSHVERVFIS